MNPYEYWERKTALEYFSSSILRGSPLSDIWYGRNRIRVKMLTAKDMEFLLFNDEPMFDIACAVYSLNNKVVYHSNHENIEEVAGWLCKIPSTVCKRIILESNKLLRYQNRFRDLFHDYVLSNQSRALWGKYKACGMSAERLLGEKGIDDLFKSEEFLAWWSFNEGQDKRDEHEIQYYMTKLVVGAWNGKMAQKLSSTMYKPVDLRVVQNQIIPPIRTEQDLINQLKQVVHGDLDAHDKLIMAHEERWAQAYEEEQRKIEERLKERAKRPKEEMVTSSYRILK